MEDDNYIDELNWYTEDFDGSQSKYEKKKDKRVFKPDRVKSSEKEKRLKRLAGSSKFSAPKSSSSDKIFKRPDTFLKSAKTVKKIARIRETVSVNAPIKKSAKLEKPEIKLYEPVKSLSRVKEAETFLSFPVKAVKPDKSDVPSLKTEVKNIEPLVSSFSKNAASNKELDFLSEKLMLLEERDKLIRSSLDKPSNLKQAQAIAGTCPDMCPEKERIMRSLKKMVSVYECLPDSNEMCDELAVKEYARSSADQEEPLPHELRPEPVLTMSMSYIITKIITKFEECDDVSAWYDFCWNRLRAIRKDIVQQQLCDMETVTIVEQCARFHIVCFDRFWGLDSTIFDEKINTENLMNCLKILLNLYSDLRKLGVICPNEPEFNAYMILIKMNSGDLLWEFLNFPLSLQQTPEVIEAVKIHMFYNSNMYSQFFNYLINTTYLNACLMQRCFTQLRVKALETMVKAYCPPGKEGKVSLQHIMKSLKFDNKEDAVAFCRSCNIRYVERVGFKISHNTLIRPENLMKIKTPSTLVCIKRIDFAEAVVGIYNDMPTYFGHQVHCSFLNDKTLHSEALDASDQEEKMLRDNVERKLILKNVKSSSVKENQSSSAVASPSTPHLQRSLSSLSNRKSVDSECSSINQVVDNPSDSSFHPIDNIFDPEDVEMDELSESDDYDMPDALPAIDIKDNDNIFVDVEDQDSLTFNRDSELNVYLEMQVSPLSAISADHVDEEKVGSDRSSDNEVEGNRLPTPKQVDSPEANDFQTSTDVPDSKSIEIVPVSPRPFAFVPVAFDKQRVINLKDKNNSYIMKLKNKIKSNLQRMTAKKYGRIWRDKVREIKKLDVFIPYVSHMNVKDYLNVWGSIPVKHNTIWNQLNNTKKLHASVHSLLIFNLFDTSLKKLGYPVCETLVNKMIKHLKPCKSLQQIGSVYWKLVISVPPCQNSIYDLYNQVKSWTEHAFFSSESARKTQIETMFFKGVKVHCKVSVVDGYRNLEAGRNMSALIILRVPGWESVAESQDRLNRLISVANHPIPVYAVNLASSQPSFNPPPVKIVPFFSEITAGSTSIIKMLTDLASNSYQLSIKTFYVCDLSLEMLDKFFDTLQNDCYNSTIFAMAMSYPTNIINLYNILIDKLKNEIIQNYKTNIFGTANEIILSTTSNSKYSKASLSTILVDYFDSLKLTELLWPPKTSCDLLYTFKNYCDKSGIPQVLSHVIRKINPPDEDDDQPLSEFLNNLNWLQIIEIMIKGYFRAKFCDVIVTYCEKSIDNLIDSHWWMECY